MLLILFLEQFDSAEEQLQFTQIYLKYKQLLLHTANDYLERPADMTDCVQETFLELIKRFELFVTLSEPEQRKYLVTICKRCAFRMNEKHASLLVSGPENGQQPDAQADPLQDMVCSRVDLADALRLLDEQTLQLLVMRYVEGYTAQELAAFCGISADAVRQRLHRARKKLARMMTERKEETV
ncbi:MAG: sigma-70 family RNA polymerase sigma factor [Clostridia bacterium]|nr:sigma-70 family RNA polymerase sigma factor [Clostridia bacterium]